MTWQVLHAGKFVDAEGVVLERADHEFIAKSEAFPDAALRLIARSDPVARQAPVEWEEGFFASFAQTTMKVDGVDHTVRVIDHRAFENPRGGRPYRRRTYMLQPCAEWGGADAALPVDAMQAVPAFRSMSTASAWQGTDAPVDAKALAADVGALMAGHLHIGQGPSASLALRLAAVLASLPPAVASRMEVRIGGEAPMGIKQDTASTPGDPEAGQAWLAVLRQRGAQPRLASLAQAAAQPPRTEPAVDVTRPWDNVRGPLAWAMHVEGWTHAVQVALGKDQAVPASPVDPSPRALQAVLPVLQEAAAFDRIGALAGPEWKDAWAAASPGGDWQAVATLLARRELDDAALASLARTDLAGPAAQTAAVAWAGAMARAGDAALRALMTSRAAWAKQARSEQRGAVAARALAILQDAPDPRHPFWRTREGKAVQAVLEGQEASAEVLRPLPAEDLVARQGDAAAVATWLRITGRVGEPGGRADGVAACLRLLAGVPVGPAQGFAAAWPRIGGPLPVADALRLGVPCAEAAACLPRVDVRDADGAVARLLACPDLDAGAWLAVTGTAPPWRLLWAADGSVPDAREAAVLASLGWHDVPTAARHYRGQHPHAWRAIPADAVLAWLEAGGDPAALEHLAPTAPVAVLAALGAWTRKTQRPHAAAQAVMTRQLGRLPWAKRRAVARATRRLEAA